MSTTRNTDQHRQPAQTWALEPVTGTLRELVDNPDQIDGRARQLAQQHNRRATTTTVWHWRTNGRLHAAISVTGTKQPNQLADTWAQATGSRLNPWPNDEPFPPSDNPEPIHQAHIRWRGFVGRDSLRGNPLETIEAITRTLPEGCWVAMSVRRTHRYEKNAAIAWIRMHYTSLGDPSRQLGAHPLTASAITATIYVGAPDKPAADSIIAAISGALPGTNYEMKSRTVKDRGLRTGGLIAATTAAASATLSATTSWWPTTPPSIALAAIAIGVAPELTARLFRFDRKLNRFQRHTSNRTVPAPAGTWWRSALSPNPNPEAKTVLTTRWPLRFSALVIPPVAAAEFAIPTTPQDNTAGPSASTSKPVPPAMRDTASYRFGFDAYGTRAGIPERDVYAGVMAFGEAGTGKSRFLHELWAGQLLARHVGLNNDNHPTLGGKVAMVAIETKGEPLHWTRRCNGLGIPHYFIDASNPETPRIDLFAGPSDPIAQAHQVVSAMRVAFGYEAIGNTALPALRAALSVAVQITPEMAMSARAQQGGPMVHAWTLLGGEGPAVAKQLWSVFETLAARADQAAGAPPGDPTPLTPMGRAAADFYRYANMPDRQFRETLGTSINKIEQLAAVRSLDDPARPALSWDQVLEQHHVVVINFGHTTAQSDDGILFDGITEDSARTWAALHLATLRARIQQRCVSWFDQGQAVSIFADEVSHLAAASDEVIAWLRDAGRAFGVRLFFATQRPLQLPVQVRESLKGFGTVAWFALNSPSMIAEATADLNVGGGSWTDGDIAQLVPGQTVVRGMAGGRRQPPFTCSVPLGELVEPEEWVHSYFMEDRPENLPGGRG